MKMDLVAGSRNDEYYTPEYAITPILKYLKLNSKIWCPFDTSESLYVKMLQQNGHKVTYTHIQNGEDFFDISENLTEKYDYIISNPPYSCKTEVLQRLFELNIPFAMLVGVVGLFESQRRFTLFKENEFEIMYFDKRISYLKNYNDIKPMINPPFSSVYVCHKVLPSQIIFEDIEKPL